METTEQHLFAEPEYHLVQASMGKRFANYIIDVLVFYALMFMTGIVWGLVSPETTTVLEEGGIVINVIALLVYGLYMFVIEALSGGKSLGKLITGTRAVNEDGTNVTTKAALLRGLSRAVPFNAFSALGNPSYPWHDRWANTYVIDERESNRPMD